MKTAASVSEGAKVAADVHAIAFDIEGLGVSNRPPGQGDFWPVPPWPGPQWRRKAEGGASKSAFAKLDRRRRRNQRAAALLPSALPAATFASTGRGRLRRGPVVTGSNGPQK